MGITAKTTACNVLTLLYYAAECVVTLFNLHYTLVNSKPFGFYAGLIGSNNPR